VKRFGLVVVALVAAVVCIRLGIWQLHRLGERRAINSERAERLAIPVVEFDGQGALGAALAFRRAVAEGEFDFARELVVVGRSIRGVPGVHLVTPLRLSDGSALLVERGWVPSPDGRSVDLRSYREPSAARVTGLLLDRGAPNGAPVWSDSAWPRYLRRATPESVRSAYPYPLLDLVLRRAEVNDSLPHGLRLIPLPELSDGPHLSYAVQWFAFATIAVFGSAALLWKGRAEARSVEES
jgi:surfeit locus 1 family protein